MQSCIAASRYLGTWPAVSQLQATVDVQAVAQVKCLEGFLGSPSAGSAFVQRGCRGQSRRADVGRPDGGQPPEWCHSDRRLEVVGLQASGVLSACSLAVPAASTQPCPAFSQLRQRGDAPDVSQADVSLDINSEGAPLYRLQRHAAGYTGDAGFD